MKTLQLSEMISLEILSRRYSREIAAKAVLNLDEALELGIVEEDLELVKQASTELQQVLSGLLQNLAQASVSMEQIVQSELEDASQSSAKISTSATTTTKQL